MVNCWEFPERRIEAAVRQERSTIVSKLGLIEMTEVVLVPVNAPELDITLNIDGTNNKRHASTVVNATNNGSNIAVGDSIRVPGFAAKWQ